MRKRLLASNFGLDPHRIGFAIQSAALQVDTLRSGILGKNRNEFAARYCGRRLLCSRPGRSGQKHYDNSGVARPQELRGLLMKVRIRAVHEY